MNFLLHSSRILSEKFTIHSPYIGNFISETRFYAKLMTLPPGYEATAVGSDTRSRIVPEMIPVKKKSQTFSARGVQRDEKFSALAPRLSCPHFVDPSFPFLTYLAESCILHMDYLFIVFYSRRIWPNSGGWLISPQTRGYRW